MDTLFIYIPFSLCLSWFNSIVHVNSLHKDVSFDKHLIYTLPTLNLTLIHQK